MAVDNTSTLAAKRVLYIGDSTALHDGLTPHFDHGDSRFTVEVVADDETARQRISDHQPDCVLFDYNGAGQHGTEQIRRIHDEQPAVPIIALVGDGDESRADEAIRAGATDCLHTRFATTACDMVANRVASVVSTQQSTHQPAHEDHKLDQILTTVPTAITQVAANGEIVFANQHAQDHLGVEPSEATDRTYNDPQWEITDVDGTPLPDEELPFQQVMDTGEPIESFRHNIVWPDGQSRTVEINGSPLCDDAGDIESVVFSIVDITEQRDRVDQLERYQKYLEHSPDVVHLLAADGTVTYQSPSTTQAGDFIPRDLVGKEPNEFVHPADQERVQSDFEEVLASGPGETIKTEFRIETAEGDYNWFESRATNYLDHEPIDGILVTSRYIDDRKTRKAELESERTFIEQALNGINDIFYVIDADGTIERWNEQLTSVTGYTETEIAGMAPTELFPESEQQPIAKAIATTLADGAETIEAALQTKSGELIPYEWSGARLHDTDGNVTGIVGIGRDISQQKARETKLRETTRRLETVLEKTATGVWTFDIADKSLVSIKMPDEIGFETQATDIEAYLQQIHPADRGAVQDAIESAIDQHGEFDIEFRLDDDTYERWLRAYGTVIDEDGGSPTLVGLTREVTERVHRTNGLEKRQRVLQELHKATQQLYTAKNKSEVAAVVVELLEDALDLSHVAISLFSEETGTLQTVGATPEFEAVCLPNELPPGSHPVWEAYRTGESNLVGGEAVEATVTGDTESVSCLLAVPIGDFGVVVACRVDNTQFETVDTDLVEIIAANTAAAFEAIETMSERTELAAELSTQQTQTDELRQVVETMQSIQNQVSQAESRAEICETVCAELTNLNTIEFAWIGRPQATDTALETTATSGGGEQYIATVRSDTETPRLPAHLAADRHEVYKNGAIAADVRDTCWAKEALSSGYRSVLSVPLVHEGVVYNVITVYAAVENAFTTVYETLLNDIGLLVLNFTQTVDRQQPTAEHSHTVATFGFNDDSYPLQALAERSDSRIHFNTVVRTTDEGITLLATVDNADRQTVQERADDVAAISSAKLIGTADSQQLLVEVTRPSRLVQIENHGGRVRQSTATPNGSKISLWIKAGVSTRPLLEFVATEFSSAELLSKEDKGSTVPDEDPVTSLTERQREVVSAAYHGGYYETPREITGEDLAESFDISSPVIYNHLQAAHKKILRNILDTDRTTTEPTLNN